jgi:hypothetical protein
MVSTYAISKQELSNSEPFLYLFICQFLLWCQSVVKPYRHAETVIRESMCLAGYLEKHMPRLYPRHKQDQPVPLLSRVSRSPSKLGLLAPILEARPQYGAKTSTYPHLQWVGPERARAHDKRVTSLPSPHPLVYARDKKICDLTRVHATNCP